MVPRASARSRNQCWFKHSSRNLPLKLSTNAFSTGLPGSMKSSVIPVWAAQRRKAWAVNSGPLSRTMPSGAAALDDESLQDLHDPRGGQRSRRLDRQTFPTVVIDHIEGPERPPAGEAILNEVYGPASVEAPRQREGGTRCGALAPGASHR